MDMRVPLDTYYIEMDWPAIPDELCKQLIEHAKGSPNIWEGRHVVSGFEQYEVLDSLKDWLYNNLPIDLNGFQIRLQCSPNEELFPHKDAIRASSFNFVLTDDGGRTIWSDSEGKELCSINYKKNVWYQHQSQITHTVENIKPPRIAVTLFKLEVQDWYLKTVSQ